MLTENVRMVQLVHGRRLHCCSESVQTVAAAATLQLLLLASLHLPASVANAPLSDCSRARSRLARIVVGTQLQPLYTARKLDLPAGCPLSRQRDVYASEQAAIHPFGTDGRLVCGICGKTIRSLDEADSHMATMHADEFNFGQQNRTCLADFCDVLRCDAFAAAQQPSADDAAPAAESAAAAGRAHCQPSRMAELRLGCESLLLSSCVPAMYEGGQRNEQAESSFGAAVVAAVCAPLTCDRYWETMAGGGGMMGRPAVNPSHRVIHYVVAAVSVVAVVTVALMCFINLLRSRGGPTEMQRFIKEVEDDEFVSSESGDSTAGLRHRHVGDVE